MNNRKNMTIEEVKKYYGKKYRPIIKALETKGFTNFRVDTDCYRYLELSCENKNNQLSVNHGISNKLPYNVWRSYGKWGEIKRNSFSSMSKLADYILTL